MIAFFLAGSIALVAAPDPHPAPVAPIIPVADDYWGVKVTEQLPLARGLEQPRRPRLERRRKRPRREFLDNLP